MKKKTNFRSSRTMNMEKKIKWVAMKLPFLQINLLLACISFSFSSISTAHGTRVISHNDVNPDQESSLKTYIVHIDEIPNEVASAEPRDIHSWYHSFLPLTTTSSSQQNSRMVHTYQHVVSGFAARLTAEEAKAMEMKDEIVSVVAEKILPLHTTRSPSFMGLSQGVGLWNISNYGQGVIIGVLDTGIEPDHPSFNDKGMPVPPAKWKGKCEFSMTSTCNNKLIGARSFGNLPPFDDEGHGTHTSSIAAGSFVEGASVFGLANGTAVGIAALAHLAIYKVCSSGACPQSSILAAIDAAIEDGVDVISMSLGGSPMKSFSNDVLAIASFRAMQHGIFVSCSAGNIGPFNSTVSNPSPWVLTVGASTIDRSIRATARLGNLEEFGGESVFQPSNFTSTLLPLVYPNKEGTGSPAVCNPVTLKQVDVKGKVVFCQGDGGAAGISRGEEVMKAGGAAMIVMNEEIDGNSILATNHVLPATQVSYPEGLKIKAYMNSTSEPMATIVFKGTELGNSSAPMVLSLSSRGPGLASPGILKPDILGPGVNILAAWPFPNKTASFYFNTGTSMACPHISGVAALLKSSHPDWSPAAIKSAIMTTANVTNLQGLPILDYTSLPANLFATGAGHVNPSKANDPGLVYDIQPDDYIPYLCGLEYSDKEIEKITRRQAKCSKVKSIAEAELNYPSFSIVFGRSPQIFTRKVTNVGPAGNSSYSVEVVPPKGVSVRVMPEMIIFGEVKQTISYNVTFSRENEGGSVGEPNSQGFLNWVSSEHSVRSPISVMFK